MAEIIKLPIRSGCQDKTVVDRQEISNAHPVAIAHDTYIHSRSQENWAPSIKEILASGDRRLSDYLMFLAPCMRSGEPDCRIVMRGEKIPGQFNPQSTSGCSYSDFLKTEAEVDPAGLLAEVFFSLVTRHVLLAETSSPFKSVLRVSMYRGIFPVWNSMDDELWAAIICAPKYVGLDT